MIKIDRKQIMQLLIIAGITLAIIVILNFTLQKLVKKMIYPVHGEISSPFGTRVHPISKEKKFHNGIDIAVPEGTTVKAAGSGVVIDSWNDDLNGNAVKIKHDNGYTTGYAHLSRSYVTAGQRVTRGERIAASGSTGASTGPHLHLTMRDSAGNYVNPVDFLI